MKRLLLFSGVLLSAFLLWFAITTYHSAAPLAEENLRGLALSLRSAIENIASTDDSLKALNAFQSHEIAFFALIDQHGYYRFHSNPDLTGTRLDGVFPSAVLSQGTFTSSRVKLRSGEQAFEFVGPVVVAGETLALKLTLHTYRADSVIRRARLNLLVQLSLLCAGWILAGALYRTTRREEQRKLDMAHRENLARLGEMGAMLAHEIRNPLAGIKGFGQFIHKKPQDVRNEEFAGRIVMEAQRLESLVGDLLAYARNDLQTTMVLNVGDVVDQTVALLRHEAGQSDIEIIFNHSEMLSITGNRDRLVQLFLNLGKNALQAMPDGGELHFISSRTGSSAVIAVQDTGHGINPDELKKIFEPFYTTKARGTGLGLALCKKIVEDHNGDIQIDSVIGQGTSVTVKLPLCVGRSV